ncbi:MAG: type II toxin-antitoxin system RelE family toxin [Nanoarchaeota archaeon]
MQYVLKETEEFRKEFLKLPANIQKRFRKQMIRLKENPFALGKPLKGKRWLRELKNKKFRVYYMIIEEDVLVLLISVSDKKHQQKVIDAIIDYINETKYIKNQKG